MLSNYWVFLTLTLALLAFLSYGTYATARLLQHWRPDRNLLLIPEENLLRLLLVAGCVVLGLVSGLPLTQLGWTMTNTWSQLGWGVLWGSALALFFYGATRWLVQRTGQRFYSSVVIQTITPRNGRELFGVLLSLISVVFLEELLFRSLLIGGLTPLAPASLLLVVWGIVFGLLHSPQGIWGMLGAGLAGLLFGILFVTQGSLLLPLVAHYVANALQVLQAMRLRDTPFFENSN
ncbi:MAG: type II CAAX endopeptidase family protein [Caldilineaceae bacterium]